MTHLETLRSRRSKILKEMSGLEQMRRGSVVEQFVEMVKADGSKVRRGPYALYSYKENKKTVSRRGDGFQADTGLPQANSGISAFSGVDC